MSNWQIDFHSRESNELCATMPVWDFPKGWRIKIIPPCNGATTRFVVYNMRGHGVSVYSDHYANLGAWDEPHWEIYPNAQGDNQRFLLAEVEEAKQAISRALRSNATKGRFQ